MSYCREHGMGVKVVCESCFTEIRKERDEARRETEFLRAHLKEGAGVVVDRLNNSLADQNTRLTAALIEARAEVVMWKQRAEGWSKCADTHQAEIERLKAQVGEWKEGIHRGGRCWDETKVAALTARIEAMEPVVEAAAVYRHGGTALGLFDAIDDYEALRGLEKNK